MWKCLSLGCALAATALAQNPPSQLELANLREDVRGLIQRVGELTLRLEQLERENADLRARTKAADKSYASLAQLNEAIADLNRNIRTAVAASKTETLQQVAAQLEKLAKQTNAALDSLAKAQASRPAVQASFADNYSKEGVSYTVQKGDTIAVIAKKTGAKQQDIINANKIADPSHITIGQTLFIPGGK
ncbi:MAG: LysM peptidoglycan-binding domain-containing protein [Verrucomicrobia bacterium]|nr:LysM peptidoglycan-binding domain-containing protein [Verrucomicrobiota bacterium]